MALRRRQPLRSRTGLKPGKALKATKALVRHVGLAQVGRKRRETAEAAGKPVRATLTSKYRPAVPDGVRAALAKRSKGMCEMQLHGCTGVAVDPSHRISSKNGGRHGEAKERHDRLSNLIHACRRCHEWVTSRDVEAKDDGLRLDEWQSPPAEPVLYRGVLSYLTDDGRVLSYEEVGA
jgi:hypothetical protein